MTRSQHPFFIAFVGLLVEMAWGCGETDDEPRNFGDGGSGACANCLVDGGSSTALVDMGHCTNLDPSQCVTDPACTTMYGLWYDRAQHCRAAGMVAVGCRGFLAPCGGSYTLATDAMGGSWRLPDICLPPGWSHPPAEPQPARWVEDFPVCPSSQVEANCARLATQAACALDPACYAVLGVRMNELHRCKEGAPQFVGCTQNKGCNGLASLSKDLSGGLWELPGVCSPLGWTKLANTDANSQRHDWPACR